MPLLAALICFLMHTAHELCVACAAILQRWQCSVSLQLWEQRVMRGVLSRRRQRQMLASSCCRSCAPRTRRHGPRLSQVPLTAASNLFCFVLFCIILCMPTIVTHMASSSVEPDGNPFTRHKSHSAHECPERQFSMKPTLSWY